MINNINSNIVGLGAKEMQKRPSARVGSEAPASDVSVQVQYDSLVTKAMDSDVDVQAVERAKELLSSGQLDTPENIREAATNMVQYGI